MRYHTEAKAQGWRAVAVFDDRPDCLLYVGRSSTQVRGQFPNLFFELLDEEERTHVRQIALQRWQGAPDSGKWLTQTELSIPQKQKLSRAA